MGIHDGHRERMKKRLELSENMEDHELLEVLLYYALPRGDTNPVAHELINRFGGFYGVLDAPKEELMRIDGIGEHAADLIKTIPVFARRYLEGRSSMDDILTTSAEAGRYLLPRFCGERDEVVYMVCLDAKRKVICTRLLGRGSVNSANVSVRKIVETSLKYNASCVIIAHNHTSGIALPSKEDSDTTLRIAEALAAVDVILLDHIVVADDDFVSMSDNGLI